MLRFPMDMGHCSPCASTASAALMKGWISSIFISVSRARGAGHGAVISHHILDDFIQNFGLDRLLYEMARPSLQCRHNVLLISHRRHHDHARFGMLLHDFLGSLDPLH